MKDNSNHKQNKKHVRFDEIRSSPNYLATERGKKQRTNFLKISTCLWLITFLLYILVWNWIALEITTFYCNLVIYLEISTTYLFGIK